MCETNDSLPPSAGSVNVRVWPPSTTNNGSGGGGSGGGGSGSQEEFDQAWDDTELIAQYEKAEMHVKVGLFLLSP